MANINERLLTKELIRELFEYKDGFLYWKIRRTNAINVGDKAGTENPGKYGKRRKIGIGKLGKFYASRLIYLYHNSIIPDIIDHIDGNPENNLIENLRPATKRQNNVNCRSSIGSSSKYLGVSFHKKTKKWQAKCSVNGKGKYLGIFKTEEEAAECYNKNAIIYYGEFANLNIISHPDLPI